MAKLPGSFQYYNKKTPDHDVAAVKCEESQTMGLSDPERMKVIEELRDLRIGQLFVSLPRIVVVGDQSSGKSSVLEAIHEDSVSSRHWAFVKVSIIPGPSCEKDRIVALKKFEKVWLNIKTFEPKQFLDILEEASNLMEVTGPNKKHEEGKKSFSDDVLKIDYSGPDHENLSIVDVPGIFHNPEQNVTTDDDVELVRNMVNEYIEGEGTIILAVLPACVDIGTQKILQMAKKVDPKGRRTLGVLTKPDLVDRGAEESVIDLLQGNTNQLALGYHMLRNPGKRELDALAKSRDESELDSLVNSRDETERNYFATSLWKKVDKDRAGIASLKANLRYLLTDITRREFPNIKAEIKKKLSAAERSLAGMGTDRESSDEQRRFLEDIAMNFQAIRDDAMATVYHQHEILEDYALRLPTLVANRNDLFLKDIKSKGHFVQFEKGADDSDDSDDEVDEADENNEDKLATTDATKRVKYLNLGAAPIQNSSYDLVEVRKTFPELQDILVDPGEVSPPSQTGIKRWIKKEYRAARGFDLDLMNSSIMRLLWQRQSCNWESIARKYINDIIFYVHRFTFLILKDVCSDERAFEGLKNHIMEELFHRYSRSIEHVAFIVKVERFGTLITKNHYFAHTLKKIRIERNDKETKKLLAELRTGTEGDGNPKESVIIHDHLTEAGSHQSNFKHAIDNMHDILMVYYNVARKRFTDIVITQAADYYLLTGLESPLNILTPRFISRLTPGQLEKIAGEDMASKNSRENLKERIDLLKKGESIIDGHMGK